MAAYQPPLKGEAPRIHDDAIIIPFKFFNLANLDQLDPLDSDGRIMCAATGSYPPREPRPFEPFTAWVTMAHLGLIEEGGPLLKPELNREQRLEAARELLSEEELLIVESIAVPRRYRHLPVAKLVEMVRTAPDYIDRMWAGCWLILIGWTESSECSFLDARDMPERMCGELEETIVEAYAASIGVSSRDDVIGWRRVDNRPEVLTASRRLGICETHYMYNGPPPYEHMKDTVTAGAGWRQIARLVPAESGYV